MGFSVSASAAIIFISFLVAASTLYTAWDNSYTNVQAAREGWYSLRESQLHFNAEMTYLERLDADGDGYSDDLRVDFVYAGTQQLGNIDIMIDGSYIRELDFDYFIPGSTYTYYIYNAFPDANPHYVYQAFDNGCILWFEYQYSSSGTGVTLLAEGTYCPTEVS
jgi:flagellar protein FlaF